MTIGCGERGNDYLGKVFGRLTVVENLGRHDASGAIRNLYLCKCICGKETRVFRSQLQRGNTRSCGCLFMDTLNERNTTHGRTKTKEFKIWLGMNSRCNIESATGYKNYGGKGLKVCPEWANSFETFLRDMGEAPTQNHSIDRIDNALGYSKENCRWATRKRQSYNSSKAKLVNFEGKIATISDWERATGHKRTLSYRLRKGWDVEKAILTPPRGVLTAVSKAVLLDRIDKILEGIDK